MALRKVSLTTGTMFFTWARAATSGITPPVLLWMLICELTTDDMILNSGLLDGYLPRKIAAAVSSQLVSMAKIVTSEDFFDFIISNYSGIKALSQE